MGALPGAIAGIVAVLATFVTMYEIGARFSAAPSVDILSAVLALTLARSDKDRSPWLIVATLPVVAIASALVGYLLASIPILGAAFFIAAIVLSVWLRQFGARASGVGALIALPFVVILISPVRSDAPGGPFANLALVVCAGLVAFAWVAIVRYLAARASRPEPRPAREGELASRSFRIIGAGAC